MKKFRYLIAGAISLLIHGIALSFVSPKPEITLADTHHGQAVSIQLVSVAQPKQERPPETLKSKDTQSQLNRAPEASKTQAKLTKTKAVKTNAVKTRAVKKKPIEKLNTSQSKKAKQTAPKQQKVQLDKPIPEPKVPLDEPEIPTTEIEPAELKKVKKIEQVETNTALNTSNSMPKMVNKPTFSAKPTPVRYPRLAQKRGWQGSTLIEVWIDKEGQQIQQDVIQSSGHELLDEAAINAVTQWQFERRDEQGQRIAYRVQVPINFKLN
ncbi:hypothetical protein A9264_13225 [Vibrio sp. UCD-FRSSP16_10]|nr:hypothetical protein A9260_13440 [Vibrio sp. UCD-FRSSP16_30]OBT20582.1 hypothetical protein A9264_13225 [Vibrio sp. UCD-FRSSP16_10]